MLLRQFSDLLVALLVRVGVDEGELNTSHVLVEKPVELEHQFFVVVHPQRSNGVGQPVPRGDLSRVVLDAADGTVHFGPLGLSDTPLTMA